MRPSPCYHRDIAARPAQPLGDPCQQIAWGAVGRGVGSTLTIPMRGSLSGGRLVSRDGRTVRSDPRIAVQFADTLLEFQDDFVRAALLPDNDLACLSLPRGNGKSSLAAWLAARALTPGDGLYRHGKESHIIAASVGQARRTTFKLLKRYFVDRDDYFVGESLNEAQIRHKPSGTRITVLAANHKTAQGLVDVPVIIGDEPGSWEVSSGTAVWDAIETAQGKPDSDIRIILIGTLGPHGVPGHWWHKLINGGSTSTTHVYSLQGDRKHWDDWDEVARCNPLMVEFAKSRAKLRSELDDAHSDSRLRARFSTYRLNVPSRDESSVVLSVGDWESVERRDVPPRTGRPVVGLDLGGGRAWSAAVAVWPNGRTEAVAVAPGIPSISDQERRDRVARGTYQALVDAGLLHLADGLRVPSPKQLVEHVRQWGPRKVICDRFRLQELKDAARLPYEPRVTRWSEAAHDIRACRKMAKDGPLSVDPACTSLLEASLSVAMVKTDDQGSYRMVKRSDNCARDDVASALVLACGGLARMPVRSGGYLGVIGA